MKKILLKNKLMFWLGTMHLFVFAFLFIYSFFNEAKILGINAMIKPMKFALSIWIYSWTMALILHYLVDKRKAKVYVWIALICMSFEQVAITLQACRGQLSHFNTHDSFGIILYSLMGVFILTITVWTGYITFIFIKQNVYELHPAIVVGIKFGLIYFVVFSLFGGYISSLQGHTVGAADGGQGLWLLNWSTQFGDLRAAHFFGIHSLQIIPLFAIFSSRYFTLSTAVQLGKIFSIVYLLLVLFILVKSLLGLPFVYN